MSKVVLTGRSKWYSIYRDELLVGTAETESAAMQLIRQDVRAINSSASYEAVVRRLIEATLEEDSIDPPIDPPIDPGDGSGFRGFTAMPEIAFLSGCPESEDLSPFLLDIFNRRPPGDWLCEANWFSSYPIMLKARGQGLPPGLSWNPIKAKLTYDGTNVGALGASVIATLSAFGFESEPFLIRVVYPTDLWGLEVGPASALWPDAQAHTGSFFEARKSFAPGRTAESPRVLVITQGHYTEENWYLGKCPHMYVMGMPNRKPICENSAMSSLEYRRRYFKNLDLVSCGIQGTALREVCLAGDNSDDHITKVTMRDEQRWGTAISTPSYENDHGAGPERDIFPIESRWRTHLWNFYSTQMGATDGTQHLTYLQGRPNTESHINNIRVDGTRRCDAIKSTRSHVSVRNCYLSAVQDEDDLTKGLRSAVLIDIPACAPNRPHIIYNNELVGAGNEAQKGIKPAMVYIRSRRDWNAADDPHYPDRTYDPPTMWSAGYNRGPDQFVSPQFWANVTRLELTDPQNAETFKHFLSFNKYRWIEEDGYKQTSAYRNEGTHPREALSQFSPGSKFLRVPNEWVDRSCGFVYGEAHEGFGDRSLYVTDESELVAEIEPGAKWPRDPSIPSQWPSLVFIEDPELPTWFLV